MMGAIVDSSTPNTPTTPTPTSTSTTTTTEQQFTSISTSTLSQDLVQKAHSIISERDKKTVPDFWANKYVNEAARHWDVFYKRNTTNAYKDRHWTDRDFEELSTDYYTTTNSNTSNIHLLEIGCGVGNFIWPILRLHPNFFIYACDFSPRAIEFVQKNPSYNTERSKAFVCDLTLDSSLLQNIPPESLDLVTAIFVLGAIPPAKMKTVIRNIKSVLKPGGKILFRDHGLYDGAMLRFKGGQKMPGADNLYVRSGDGTLAYYFSVEFLEELFEGEGFEVLENRYVLKQTVNRKEDISIERVFVHGRFRKPLK